MRKIIFSVFVILLGCQPSDEKLLWLKDYEYLKEELTVGYANLHEAVKKENIDLVELNQVTITGLKNATSKSEAQSIIQSFLKKFNDGHLRAFPIKAPSITDQEADNNVYKTDSIDLALEKMGFEKNEVFYSIRYDSISGYRSLKLNDDPFDTGIVVSSKGNIGVLKLHSFGHWPYWKTAVKLWKLYREKIDKSCDSDCQEEFIQEVESVLSKKLIERLEQLQKENISSVLLDVSDNGGGTSWYEEVARFFSNKNLIGSKMSFVKHKHWNSILKEHLKLIEQDISNLSIKKELKQKLKLFKALVQEKINQTQKNCSLEEVWKQQKFDCTKLIEHSYATKLPFDIINDEQFNQLQTKQILNTSRFLPFRRNVYSGLLYIVQNKYSASATEGFTSLLQLNNEAVIIGKTSYGAGCGYSNGGINIELKNLGLIAKMPDCSRYRKDGKNEIYGIEPDIFINWKKNESEYLKGFKVIESIKNAKTKS